MEFIETKLAGAFVIKPSPISDQRGSFARVFCGRTFRLKGLHDQFVQSNHTRTEKAGTIRGLHYQVPPFAEAKLLRCLRGKVFDVIVDVRRKSPTFLDWHGVELDSQNQNMIYVPPGFAHGFQALTDGCEVTYQSSSEYSSKHERQLRYDDACVKIQWMPLKPILSPKDESSSYLEQCFDGVDLDYPVGSIAQ